MIEHPISIQLFTEYFDKARLGIMDLPNGECVEISDFERGKRPMRDTFPLSVSLDRLYRAITGWELDASEVNLDDILGVLAIGDACAYPGTTEGKRKKYFLFGEEKLTGKQVPLRPKVADFLVITKREYNRQEVSLPPVRIKNRWAYAEDISEGGIHVITRPVEYLSAETPELHSGVPILNNGTRILEELYGIPRERTVLWDRDSEGQLQAGIE